MEELLVSYNDKPFVSEAYRAALDGVGGRAERMAARDLPPELPEWIDTLGQDNVRALSVTLLIDLLTLETRRGARRRRSRTTWRRSPKTCCCRAPTSDARVGDARARPSAPARRRRSAATPAGWRSIGSASRSAMRETAALLGDLDDAGAGDDSRRSSTTIGAASDRRAEAGADDRGADARRRARADDAIVGVRRAGDRPPGVARRGPALVRRSATRARLLGRIGARRGACRCCSRCCARPIRASRARRCRRSARIHDPAAARAIHTVLRAATGELRARGDRRAGRRARRARRADAGAHHRARASRSARITRSCSRR